VPASDDHPVIHKLDGIVNLFYVAIVLAVGFLVAALSAAGVAGLLTSDNMTIVTNPGTPQMQVIVKEGDKITKLDMQSGTEVQGIGTLLGSFYKLAYRDLRARGVVAAHGLYSRAGRNADIDSYARRDGDRHARSHAVPDHGSVRHADAPALSHEPIRHTDAESDAHARRRSDGAPLIDPLPAPGGGELNPRANAAGRRAVPTPLGS